MPYELNIYTFEFSSLTHHLQALQQAVKDRQATINQLKAQASEVVFQLQIVDADLISQIYDLRNQLLILNGKPPVDFNEPPDLNAQMVANLNAYQERLEKYQRNFPREWKRLKKVYSLIQRATHPDLVSDPQLLEIFYGSKLLFEDFELKALEGLYRSIVKYNAAQRDPDMLRITLRNQIDKVMSTVRQLDQTVQDCEGDADVVIYRLQQKGRRREARRVHRQELRKQIDDLFLQVSQKQRLKEEKRRASTYDSFSARMFNRRY